MKRSDLLILLSAAIFTYLFYEQEPGLNIFLFNAVLVVVLSIFPGKEKGFKYWLMCGMALFTSFLVFYFGPGPAILANLVSLMILSGTAVDPKSSVIANVVFSFYSLIGTVYFIVRDMLDRKAGLLKTEITTKPKFRFLVILLPLVVVILFFALYRQASPMFAEFTNNLTLEWISFPAIFCTLLGMVLLRAFLKHETIGIIVNYDRNAPNAAPNDESNLVIFGKVYGISDQNLSGIILFASLNVMLLLVNIFDYSFLFNGTLPTNVNYSDYVHQGVAALIFSIVFAIVLILIYFRGGINYFTENKGIKALAYLWMVLNLAIVVSTICRNAIYIEEYGLTYLRIGVYVFLFLSISGLLLTLYKIAAKRSNYFLIRNNAWCFYAALVIIAAVNWDQLIFDTNISNMKPGREVDSKYLVQIGSNVLPDVIRAQAKGQIQADTLDLQYRLENFRSYQKEREWQSYNLQEAEVMYELNQLNANGTLEKIGLSVSNNHITK